MYNHYILKIKLYCPIYVKKITKPRRRKTWDFFSNVQLLLIIRWVSQKKKKCSNKRKKMIGPEYNLFHKQNVTEI